MFKTLKMKLAARRVERNKTATKKTKPAAKKHSDSAWTRIWAVITWPFRMIWRGLVAFWNWVRCIDLIGLINLTLLIAIIVLFSMLIMDLCRCGKKTIVMVPATEVAPAVTVVTAPVKPQIEIVEASAPVRPAITLPIQKKTTAEIKKTATQNTFHGDVIIDGELPGTKISHCAVINGNLYLQNMRKYTLPQGVVINGDLYIRNVSMLKFYGEFTVTGNIYVTHNSSFGAIPKTARVGGQIIL